MISKINEDNLNWPKSYREGPKVYENSKINLLENGPLTKDR